MRKSRNQVALNWLLHEEPVMVIPKAVQRDHLVENATACGWKLSTSDYELISKAFS
jgi:diketogulonate reductase-like aldo/keto reductase